MTRTPFLAATVALAVITTGCGEIKDLVSLPRLKAADMEPALTPQTSVILDATGNVITTFHGAQNRTVVPIDRVRPHTRKAVIAIEDRRFYEHDGVDLRGIARAAVANFKMGGVAEGGSTITQQFVKNRIIAPEKGPVARSIKRKIREAALARQLEQKLSKKEILERYLNTIYFGNGAYGIQAAAKTYFDRPSHKLTLRQSALLAGLIKAPETYDPYDHPKRARKRRNLVLRNMEQVGFIAPKRRKAAASRKMNLNETPRKTEYPAPYFVDYVKRLLVFHPRFDFLGDSPAERSRRLYTGGLRIHTTLVPRHQQAAERAIDKVLTERSDPHASLVAMDPRDGKVKAIVGGRNFFAGKKKNKEFSKLNLAITARPDLGRSAGNNAAPGSGRQAGSAFKPFALAAALDDGIAMTQRYNAPPCETFPKANDGKPWKVCNYGSSGYGQVDLREATTKSINVAYAKLVLNIGPQKVTRMARRLGIKTPLQAVNSGALGTNPVSPLGMATAYATLANNGKRPEPIAITRIVDSTGKRIFKHETKVQRKADAAVAYTVNDALKDVMRDGTGTAAQLGRPAAGKTGTAQEYRDAWFAGSVPQLTAAVWVGYPEASIEMKTSCGARPSNECRPTRIQVSGGTWPAEIWREYMRTALARYPVKDFKKPKKGLERWTIDTRTGCRATFETPDRFKKKVLRVEDNSPARERCRQLRDRFDDMGSASADDSDGSSGAGGEDNARERKRNRDDDAGQSPSGGSGGSGEQDPLPQPEPEPEPEPEQSPTEEPSPEPEPEPTPTEQPSPEPTDVNEPTPSPSP